jgi:hypothetical protein
LLTAICEFQRQGAAKLLLADIDGESVYVTAYADNVAEILIVPGDPDLLNGRVDLAPSRLVCLLGRQNHLTGSDRRRYARRK